jgi:hypothetical protein
MRHFGKWNAHRCEHFIFQNAPWVLPLCKRVCVCTYTKKYLQRFFCDSAATSTCIEHVHICMCIHIGHICSPYEIGIGFFDLARGCST